MCCVRARANPLKQRRGPRPPCVCRRPFPPEAKHYMCVCLCVVPVSVKSPPMCILFCPPPQPFFPLRPVSTLANTDSWRAQRPVRRPLFVELPFAHCLAAASPIAPLDWTRPFSFGSRLFLSCAGSLADDVLCAPPCDLGPRRVPAAPGEASTRAPKLSRWGRKRSVAFFGLCGFLLLTGIACVPSNDCL